LTDWTEAAKKGDMMYELETRIILNADLEEVFAFFSDAGNLETLTPAFLHFRIVTPKPIKMQAGTLIDYRLKVHGIPIGWRSEITAWDPPNRFIDEQLRGPYRCWIHEHLFEKQGQSTVVTDRVSYDHFGGRLINRFLVAPDLNRIFKFREEKLRELFPNSV
jgi:ligand-binding SRPBCC domain-containing protein